MQFTRTALALTLLALAAPGARAQEQQTTPPAPTSQSEPAPEPKRERHPVLMYIPNRIFDILDIVRLRVRVGPGLAVGARATEAVDLNLGAYTSIFAGLPGPRGRPRLNLPIGIENYAGAEVSVVGTKDGGDSGPHYGALEVGAGFQAGIIGLDIGIDPGEILDLASGLVFVDLVGDDY
jgi:hypothetical protein